MKFLPLYRRRWALVYLPMLFMLAGLLGLALFVWQPLPPRQLSIGTGPGQSSYLALARAYATRLEHMGIAVNIVSHDRPQTPLERLARGDKGVDVTFAQGLYAPDFPELQALAVVGHEIVWVFARRELSGMSQLRGKRIAASVPRSSSRQVAEMLLRHVGIGPTEVSFTEQVGQEAVSALDSGLIDAVVHVAAGGSQTVAALTRLDNVHLLGVEKAGLLASREPRLRSIVMPQGVIELRSNLPPVDLPTMVTLTHLLVRPDLHPALQRALLDVAGELHVMTGFLENRGVYPTLVGSSFAASPTAQKMLRGHRPWMERLLPFGVAQWAELVWYALLPIAILGAVLLRRAPRYLDWRAEAQLQHHYGELKFLEDELSRARPHTPDQLQRHAMRLNQLEREVMSIELPDRYADRWYTLREHMQHVRQRLHTLQHG